MAWGPISIGGSASGYTLPTATKDVLGGVKTGTNITNTGGTISLTKDNVTGALGFTPANSSHGHSAGDISSGTLPVARGGTGAANALAAYQGLSQRGTVGKDTDWNALTAGVWVVAQESFVTGKNQPEGLYGYGTVFVSNNGGNICQVYVAHQAGVMVFRERFGSNNAFTRWTSVSVSGHTHNYAGSGSAGGSATSAVKLDTATAGSATQPVYFTGGKPAACTYTLGKSVPSNAVFTDHTYSNMKGATSSAAGTAGLVPAPAAGAQGKFLRGDGTWQAIATSSKLDAWPVGSIYQTIGSTSPASLFGGTWTEIASERVLMGASSSHAAGSTVDAGLPNITGSFPGATYNNRVDATGAFTQTTDISEGDNTYSDFNFKKVSFDASRSSSVYGKSTTVQPAAYYVHIWRRTA